MDSPMEGICDSPDKRKKKEPTWSEAAHTVLESAGDFMCVSDILDRIRQADLKDVMSGSRSTSPFARLSSIMATNSRTALDIFSRCPKRRGYFYLNPDYRPGAKRNQSPGGQTSSHESFELGAANSHDDRLHAALAMTMLPGDLSESGSPMMAPDPFVGAIASASSPVVATCTSGVATDGLGAAMSIGHDDGRQPIAHPSRPLSSMKKRRIVTPSRYEPESPRLKLSASPTKSNSDMPDSLFVKSLHTGTKKGRTGRPPNPERLLKLPSVPPIPKHVGPLDMLTAAAASVDEQSGLSSGGFMAAEIPASPKRKRGRPCHSPKPLASSSPKPMSVKKSPITQKRATATLAALSVDLESPDSILKESNLRNILSWEMYAQLPKEYQDHLVNLLPDVDQNQTKTPTGVFNNVFLNSACQLWKDQLKDGDFAPDMRSRLKQEYEKRIRFDPWKIKQFENFWGEKRRRHGEGYYVLPPSLAAIMAELPDLPGRDSLPTPVTPHRRASPPPGQRNDGLLPDDVDPLKFLAEAAEAANSFASSGKSSKFKRHRTTSESGDDSEWEVEVSDYDDEEAGPARRKKKAAKMASSSRGGKKPEKPAKKVKAGKTEKVVKKNKGLGLGRGRPPTTPEGIARRKSKITTTTTCHSDLGASAGGKLANGMSSVQAITEAVAAQPRLQMKPGTDFRSARTEGCRSVVKNDIDLRNSPSSVLSKNPPRSKIKHLKNRLLRMTPIACMAAEVSDDSDTEWFPVMSAGFDHSYAKKTEHYSKMSMINLTQRDGTTAFEHAYSHSAATVPADVQNVATSHEGHKQLSSDPVSSEGGLPPYIHLVQGDLSVVPEDASIETFLCPADCGPSPFNRSVVALTGVASLLPEPVAIPLTTANLLAPSTNTVTSSSAMSMAPMANFSQMVNQMLRASGANLASTESTNAVLTVAAPSSSAGASMATSYPTNFAGSMSRPTSLPSGQYPLTAAAVAAVAANTSNRLAFGGQALPISMVPAAMPSALSAGYAMAPVNRFPAFSSMLFDPHVFPMSMVHGSLLPSLATVSASMPMPLSTSIPAATAAAVAAGMTSQSIGPGPSANALPSVSTLHMPSVSRANESVPVTFSSAAGVHLANPAYFNAVSGVPNPTAPARSTNFPPM